MWLPVLVHYCKKRMTSRIDLTDAEAVSFLEWRRNQENWDILCASGIFGISNGSAEIHFNANGQIASIDTHQKVFRRVVVPLDKKTTQYIL